MVAHLSLHGLHLAENGRPLLAEYDLSVRRGGIHAVVSPDSRVCAALADIVAGFARPRRGTVEIDGRDLGLRGPGRRGIMSVRAEPGLFPLLTGSANIAFPLEQQRHGAGEIRRRVERLAGELGIPAATLATLPCDMQPEERVMIALARALAAEPSLLLLERPLLALPAPVRTSFLPELRRLLRQFGITTLLISDDLGEAMIGADEISVVMQGLEVQKGGADTIFKRPVNATIARLAGACNLLPVEIEPGGGQIAISAPFLHGGGVTLPSGPGQPPPAPGPGLMMMRPEAARLFLGIRRFDLLADGIIADIMPHGNGAQIRVTLDHYPRGILADVPLPAPVPLEMGRRATLGWNRGDFHLLPPEGEDMERRR